ncbi:MAG: glycosyltransferase family 2 protein [Acidimicrobiia bacterium]|nr:glycosyltransferase family 2 protein [Acidimicrobiia bacterium]NNF09160.1 glycosyltransferase family 2 protein [Acidimicrobiia bacterium]
MAAHHALPADRQPLVSVVIPVYNAARFLEEAVDSVLAQSYKHWELLLVDDGSTDNGRQICDRYALAHPDKIRVLDHPGHRGLPASRNLGVVSARGDLIAALDADDVWLPDRLEHQVQLAIRHPDVGMVCGPTWYWFSWTGLAADRGLDMRRELKIEYDRRYEPPHLLSKLATGDMHSPATGAMLIRRSVLLAVGGYVEEFPAMYEDQAMLAKVFAHSAVFVTGEALDCYRQHNDSMTARAGSAMSDIHVPLSLERRKFLEFVADYVSTSGISDAELADALETALKPYEHIWRYRILHPQELTRWAASKVLPAKWQRALWRLVRRRRTRRKPIDG